MEVGFAAVVRARREPGCHKDPARTTPDESLAGACPIEPQSKARCAAARSHLTAHRLGQAERIYREVLAADPICAEAVEGLGEIAALTGAHQDAVSLFNQVLSVEPARASARTALGLSLQNLGQLKEAMQAFRRAAADDPAYPMSHYWLGLGLLGAGDTAGAAASLNRAVAGKPQLIGILGTILYDFLERCEWRNWERLVSFLNAGLSGPHALFSPMLAMMALDSATGQAAAARLFADTLFPPAERALRSQAWPGHDRIRVGFLSTDFRDHPVARLTAALLEHFDRKGFELTAFSYGPNDHSPERRRIEGCFEHVCDLPDAAAGELTAAILEREIDILIDLNGYTGKSLPQVLAARPAPVQISYMGYPGTSGASYVDYLIADHHVIPKPEAGLYSEQIVWMPHSYQVADDRAEIEPAPPSRTSQGLPEGAFVFMGYNRAHKLSPLIFQCWMRILSRVPNSVLWLQDAGAPARENLRREAAGAGIAPERLVFAPRTATHAAHLARHRLADLFLDTLPYNAHATAADALWAGVPVVTCRGASFPARVCAGLVTEAGFPDLVTDGLSAYENLAVALAQDKPRLAALRERLRREAPHSPLFDTAAYARQFQSALRTIHERSQAGLPPASFSLEP